LGKLGSMPPSMEPLEALKTAGSKEMVKDFFEEVWRLRDALCFSPARKASLAEQLSVEPAVVVGMFSAARFLVRECVYKQCAASAVLGGGFDGQLGGLFDKIIGHFLAEWSEQVKGSCISLPRLVDVDWRVDVKTAANTVSRMAAPTALVQMHAAAPAEQDGIMGPMNSVTFEMNKETLQTMLDGLGQIRSQLSSV
jgi:hypothetical protein